MPVVMQRCGNVDDDTTRQLQRRQSCLAHVERAQQVNVYHGFKSVEAKVFGRAEEVPWAASETR